MTNQDPFLALIEWCKQAWSRLEKAKTEGQESIDEMLAHADPAVRAEAQKILALDEAVRAKMSPPGTLNLPPLLEARRLQYGITDGAFALFPLGERVVVWQMPVSDKTAGGLFKPDSTKDREHAQSPRCVLVAAGLAARDILWSNGIELGHIVRTIAYAPLRLEADDINGKSTYVLPMNCGDIVGSEDLAEKARKDEARVYVSDGSATLIVDDANCGAPKNPYVSPAEW